MCVVQELQELKLKKLKELQIFPLTCFLPSSFFFIFSLLLPLCLLGGLMEVEKQQNFRCFHVVQQYLGRLNGCI